MFFELNANICLYGRSFSLAKCAENAHVMHKYIRSTWLSAEFNDLATNFS